MGTTFGWERYAGDEGAIIGIDHFGASAPAAEILEHFGFTADRVADIARRVVREGLHGRVRTPEPGHLPAAASANEPNASRVSAPEHGGASLPGGKSGTDRGPDRDPGHS
jgi:hypothetical protein